MKIREYLDRPFTYEYGLTDRETIDILTNIFLGKDYCIVDPVTGPMANEIIVEDIITKIEKQLDNLGKKRDYEKVIFCIGVFCIGLGFSLGLLF